MAYGSVRAAVSVFYAVLTVTLFVPVLGGLYVPRAGRREGLASILTGTSVLVATHVVTGGHGYGIVSPALSGVIASALGFAGSLLAGSRRR
jgi:Na+/proline symporter